MARRLAPKHGGERLTDHEPSAFIAMPHWLGLAPPALVVLLSCTVMIRSWLHFSRTIRTISNAQGSKDLALVVVGWLGAVASGIWFAISLME